MGEEKRLWMEAALTVPDTLLLVGTSEGVLASIAEACKLLGEDIWGAEHDGTSADAVESPTSTTTGGSVSEASEHGYDFGVLLPTTCGLEQAIGNPLFTAVDAEHAEQSFRFGFPFHPARRGERAFGTESDTRDGVEIESTGDDKRIHDTLFSDAGFDHRANLLAGALGPGGPFAAHCEITRLIALHGEAIRVLALCAAPLGLILRRDDDEEGDPDRAAFLTNAHDALRNLGCAPSAAAAAEDFLRWRSPGSPRRSNWVSVSRRLVGDARRDVLEAQGAVERMRDAAVLDFFHAWMVLKRAPS